MDTTNKEDAMDTTDDLEVVLVHWLDASARADWHEPDAVLEMCLTVGFLVAENEYAIEIASTVADDGAVCNASITIPKGMIQNIQRPDEVIH